MRVLLVEDNAGDAELVRVACDEADAGAFALEHCETLADALARVRSAPAPDVVLLDLTLPDASRFEGLRRLTEAAPELPVVVLTGSMDRALGAAAIQAGAQDYLVKGDEGMALLPRALRYAIDRHDQAARARLLASERAARAAAEAARERMAVLAAASTAVSHSLEDRHALSSLVSCVVPRFADWCAIRTTGAEATTPEWISAHRDAAAAGAVSARLDAMAAAPEEPCGPRAVALEDRARGARGPVVHGHSGAADRRGARGGGVRRVRPPVRAGRPRRRGGDRAPSGGRRRQLPPVPGSAPRGRRS